MGRRSRNSRRRALLLDNEAIQAILDPGHDKHRRAMALLETSAPRNRSGSDAVTRAVVPTTARVEACWDRQAARAARANLLRIADVPLDADMADQASRLRMALGVSVADAHLGALIDATSDPCTVLTSDPDDMKRIAGHLGRRPEVVVV